MEHYTYTHTHTPISLTQFDFLDNGFALDDFAKHDALPIEPGRARRSRDDEELATVCVLAMDK